MVGASLALMGPYVGASTDQATSRSRGATDLTEPCAHPSSARGRVARRAAEGRADARETRRGDAYKAYRRRDCRRSRPLLREHRRSRNSLTCNSAGGGN